MELRFAAVALSLALALVVPARAEEPFRYSDAPLQQPPILSAQEVAADMADLDRFLTVGQPGERTGKGATTGERIYLLIDSILKTRQAEGRSEFTDFERTSLATLFDRANGHGAYGAGLVARHFAGEAEADQAPLLLPDDPIHLGLEFPSYVVTSRLAPWRLQFPYYFRITEAKRTVEDTGIITDTVIASTSFAQGEGKAGPSTATLIFTYAPVAQCQNFEGRLLFSNTISPESKSNESLMPGATTYTGDDPETRNRKEITLSSREGRGCVAFVLVGAPGVFEANRASYLDLIQSFSDFSVTPPILQVEPASVVNPVAVHKVQPIYPKKARKKKVEGIVRLQAVIEIDGSISAVQVQSCTHPNVGFEEAAVAAVRQWRYTTPLLNNRPVRIYFGIVVSFELDRPRSHHSEEAAAGS